MDYNNKLIYGKNSLQGVVSVEPKDDSVEVFIQEQNGSVRSEWLPHRYWALSPYPLEKSTARLKGECHYKYGKQFTSQEEFDVFKKKHLFKKDIFTFGDPREAFLVKDGVTYFKGLQPKEITCLSFDIETTGLKQDKTSKVLLIANTFRKNNSITRKMFCYDEYASEADMLIAWCNWVRQVDPSIVLGHNIFSYDLPYLAYCADRAGVSLNLGRDGSSIWFGKKDSRFRVDGTRDLSYKKVRCYGREFVDTMFLSVRYDIGRKYESFGLKNIIRQEGLEVKDRVFYDAGNIRNTYKNPVEWEKIKQYAKHDGDDALALFDLMVPAFFYMAQSIPKPFQAVLESASGSQLNSIMVRSYLQEGYSIPKASEVKAFEGAISFGIPGIYKNCFKIDVSSEYPSCILQYEIYDKVKDPQKHLITILDYFTKSRLHYKEMAARTGEQHYKDLDASSKTFINSLYGFLGASGLNYNSPKCAALVTEMGRKVIETALIWASGKGKDFWAPKVEEEDESDTAQL